MKEPHLWKLRVRPAKAFSRAAPRTAGIPPNAPWQREVKSLLCSFIPGVTYFCQGFRSPPSPLRFVDFQNKATAGWSIDPPLILSWANRLLGNAAFQRLSAEIRAPVLNSSAFLRHGGGQDQEPTATNADTELRIPAVAGVFCFRALTNL